jgi:hypothetical protein
MPFLGSHGHEERRESLEAACTAARDIVADRHRYGNQKKGTRP